MIRDAKIIFECVPEDIDTKFKVLQYCSELNSDSLIASCTSSLSIRDLQQQVANPSRFLGIHFMSPPLLIPHVKLIAGEKLLRIAFLGRLGG